jgi:hypothetical protein
VAAYFNQYDAIINPAGVTIDMTGGTLTIPKAVAGVTGGTLTNEGTITGGGRIVNLSDSTFTTDGGTISGGLTLVNGDADNPGRMILGGTVAADIDNINGALEIAGDISGHLTVDGGSASMSGGRIRGGGAAPAVTVNVGVFEVNDGRVYGGASLAIDNNGGTVIYDGDGYGRIIADSDNPAMIVQGGVKRSADDPLMTLYAIGIGEPIEDAAAFDGPEYTTSKGRMGLAGFVVTTEDISSFMVGTGPGSVFFLPDGFTMPDYWGLDVGDTEDNDIVLYFMEDENGDPGVVNMNDKIIFVGTRGKLTIAGSGILIGGPVANDITNIGTLEISGAVTGGLANGANGALTIDAGATLTLAADDTLTNQGTITNNGMIINAGDISAALSWDTFTGSGKIRNIGAVTLSGNLQNDFINEGVLAIGEGLFIDKDYTFTNTNQGSIEIADGSWLLNRGTLINEISATITGVSGTYCGLYNGYDGGNPVSGVMKLGGTVTIDEIQNMNGNLEISGAVTADRILNLTGHPDDPIDVARNITVTANGTVTGNVSNEGAVDLQGTVNGRFVNRGGADATLDIDGGEITAPAPNTATLTIEAGTVNLYGGSVHAVYGLAVDMTSDNDKSLWIGGGTVLSENNTAIRAAQGLIEANGLVESSNSYPAVELLEYAQLMIFGGNIAGGILETVGTGAEIEIIDGRIFNQNNPAVSIANAAFIMYGGTLESHGSTATLETNMSNNVHIEGGIIIYGDGGKASDNYHFLVSLRLMHVSNDPTSSGLYLNTSYGEYNHYGEYKYIVWDGERIYSGATYNDIISMLDYERNAKAFIFIDNDDIINDSVNELLTGGRILLCFPGRSVYETPPGNQTLTVGRIEIDGGSLTLAGYVRIAGDGMLVGAEKGMLSNAGELYVTNRVEFQNIHLDLRGKIQYSDEVLSVYGDTPQITFGEGVTIDADFDVSNFTLDGVNAVSSPSELLDKTFVYDLNLPEPFQWRHYVEP